MSTDITFIIDRSGSMESLRESVVKGYNDFLEEQRKINKNRCKLTLVQFSDLYQVDYECVDLHKAPKISYSPDGMTALLDAIGKTIISTENRLSKITRPSQKPKVLFIITTDGLENSSREYSEYSIRDLIFSKKNLGWEFIYTAANQDAWQVGSGFGIHNNFNYQNTNQGILRSYAYLSNNISLMSTAAAIGESFVWANRQV